MNKVTTALVSACLLIPLGKASAQQGGFNPAAMAHEALAQPFAGITTDGSVQSELFELGDSGVSTAPMVSAAEEFLAALNDEQREKTQFAVDDPEWRNWPNVHRFTRQGISLKEMTDDQRETAYGLLRASLSAKGYDTSRDIMRLNHHLAELVSNFDEYGEHLYWLTIMGEPSEAGAWGWQLDGHHLIVNYFVLGDQVVMTPTFMGSEPVHADSGKYAGTAVFSTEQDLGLQFMQSLPADQQKIALVGQKSGRSENQAEMFKDNITVPFAGFWPAR